MENALNMMDEGLLNELFGSSDVVGGADVEASAVAIGATFLLIVSVAAVIGLIVAAVTYVIWSLGTYRLAKKLDVDKAFLAWIPYAQYWTLGQVAEKCDERRGKEVKPWGKYFLISAVGSVVIGTVLSGIGSVINSILPGVGMIFTIPASLLSYLPLVVMCICCWKIDREFFPETVNIVLFVISVVFSVQPIMNLIASFRQPNPAFVVPESAQGNADDEYKTDTFDAQESSI